MHIIVINDNDDLVFISNICMNVFFLSFLFYFLFVMEILTLTLWNKTDSGENVFSFVSLSVPQ